MQMMQMMHTMHMMCMCRVCVVCDVCVMWQAGPNIPTCCPNGPRHFDDQDNMKVRCMCACAMHVMHT